MEFRAKDLLITVLPQAELAEHLRQCLLQTRICVWPTYCRQVSICPGGTIACLPCSRLITRDCWGGCSILRTDPCGIMHSCYVGGSACDPTIFCPGGSFEPWIVRTKDDLALLRNELQETLGKLAEIEKTGLEPQVRSREEAETLERGLTEALEQVRKMKEGFKK